MFLAILGIAFLFLSFQFPISSTATATYYIDVFPDFVGYLILWFSLEKMTPVNRWFKDASTVAAGMSAITFIQFLGGISFLLPQGLADSGVYKTVFDLVNFAFAYIGPVVTALSMILLSLISRGLGLSCEDRKKEFLSTVFFVLTIVFFALAAFAVVTLFIQGLPIEVWHIGLPVAIVFAVFAVIASRGVKELE